MNSHVEQIKNELLQNMQQVLGEKTLKKSLKKLAPKMWKAVPALANVKKEEEIQGSTVFASEEKSKREDEDKLADATNDVIAMLGIQRPTVSEDDRVPCLIYPEDPFKELFWDTLLSFILLATCLLVPFTLAFSEELESVKWYNQLNYVIDLFFLLDIFINFNTAFYREDYEIETSHKNIAINYLRGWFLIDFLSIIPLDLILSGEQEEIEGDIENSTTDSSNINEVVRIAKLSKLYRLIKVTRLVRLLRVARRSKQMMRNVRAMVVRGQAIERLIFFVLILVLCSHFLACMWIFAAKITYDETRPQDNWIGAGGFNKDAILDLYEVALYFCVQTITTVGYGDIKIVNMTERIIAIFMQLIGVISFSLAAGVLTKLISDFDQSVAKN